MLFLQKINKQQRGNFVLSVAPSKQKSRIQQTLLSHLPKRVSSHLPTVKAIDSLLLARILNLKKALQVWEDGSLGKVPEEGAMALKFRSAVTRTHACTHKQAGVVVHVCNLSVG